MTTRSHAKRTEEIKYHSYLQKGQESGQMEMQASQPHLSTSESDETANSGNHFQAHEGEKSHHE